MRFFLAAIILLVVGLVTAQDKKIPHPLPGTKAKGEVIVGYEHRMLEGFRVLINKRILDKPFDEFQKKPFEVLEEELKGVARVVAPKFLEKLRNVPIWVEWDDGEKKEDGSRTIAVYHGGSSLAYLRAGSKTDPRKAKHIEVVTLKFLSQLKQPNRDHKQIVLLHELIHAVHDQVIGMNNLDIKSAYDQAKSRELYSNVEHKNGPKREAYANTNQHEYFAETTCMYLDRVDYFPFDKDGLKTHDPVGFGLVEKIWGKVAAKPQPTTTPKSGPPPEAKPKPAPKAEIDLEKAAAAKLGFARDLIKDGKKDRAKERLKELIRDYPGTKAAGEAEKLLQEFSAP